MASLQLPPASRLFLELLAARLEIKLLRREVAELKARLGDANLDDIKNADAV
jgi:hypothetical protein